MRGRIRLATGKGHGFSGIVAVGSGSWATSQSVDFQFVKDSSSNSSILLYNLYKRILDTVRPLSRWSKCPFRKYRKMPLKCDLLLHPKSKEKMRESTIETRLRIEVEKRGGLCPKFTSPGNRGVPDRWVILPNVPAFLVETKATNGVCSKLQLWWHKRFRNLGIRVEVLNSIDQVLNLLDEVYPV